MEVLSEHICEGWLEGYRLTGRHGLFATYEAFAMVAASMTSSTRSGSKSATSCPGATRAVAEFPADLDLLAQRPQRLQPSGAGLIDMILSKKGTIARIYLPPDANCLLSVADHCFRSHDYVNLIVIDKQPQLQWLDMDEAREHCARGASTWEWASNDDGKPDVVLACAGDSRRWRRSRPPGASKHAPELKVRVVNVVDLMGLFPPDVHPHGMDEEKLRGALHAGQPVVFAFHGYQRAIHEIVHGRPTPQRFHVRGFKKEGTTTTPFDMVVLNGTSRFHLCLEALRRSDSRPARLDRLVPEQSREAPYV